MLFRRIHPRLEVEAFCDLLVNRICKLGGYFIFLTPNRRDYASLIARLIPNRYHPAIVAKTEGRNTNDTFPTYYRSNSYKSILKYARQVDLSIEHFVYLGQYPNYLTFNPILFLMGTVYDKLISKYDFLKTLRGWILVVLRK